MMLPIIPIMFLVFPPSSSFEYAVALSTSVAEKVRVLTMSKNIRFIMNPTAMTPMQIKNVRLPKEKAVLIPGNMVNGQRRHIADPIWNDIANNIRR